MEKAGRNSLLFYLLLILTAALPLAVTKYFYNVNDLPKSSVLLVLGGIIILAALSQLVSRIFKERNPEIHFPGLLDYGILIFLLSLIISALFSLRPLISLWGQYERQFGLITYLFIAAIYFIASSILSAAQRKKLLVTMEIISVLISIYAVLQFLRFDPFALQPGKVIRPVGTLGNAVFLGGFLILSFPFSLFNVSQKKNKLLKIIFPVVILGGIVITGTRSAYIALVIQLFLVYFLFLRGRGREIAKYKKHVVIILILSVVIGISFLLMFDSFFLIRLYDIFNFNNPRLILWLDSFKVFLNYPLTGSGIAMFPSALEEVYSNALRYSDAEVSVDNAHSNYLHILCTAGITGLAAYLFMLFGIFRSAITSFRKNLHNTFEENISLAVVIMAAGYAFYGSTNFDDISVTFYLFMYLAVFRAGILQKRKINLPAPVKIASVALIIVISAGCILTVYRSVNNLQADRFFLLANVEFGKGEFTKGLNLNNRAILLNPDCSAYRFTEASQVYDYCFLTGGLKSDSKQKLLLQVEHEINKIKDNLYYVNYCNGLLSLVYYETGRNAEAEKLKEEVLKKDSININYRIKLARYLLNVNRLEEALRSINLVLLIKPDEISGKLLAAIYYRKMNDPDNAITYSRLVLADDPQNKIALNILKDYGIK